MATSIDKSQIAEAYEDVRADGTATSWLLCKFEGNKIVLADKGENYEDVFPELKDDERAFVFMRVMMGDEMSKRAKFALITWAGHDLSTMKRAKMSTDKSVVKSVLKSFAIEILASDLSDVSLDVVKTKLQEAGGANYGTGIRD